MSGIKGLRDRLGELLTAAGRAEGRHVEFDSYLAFLYCLPSSSSQVLYGDVMHLDT